MALRGDAHERGLGGRSDSDDPYLIPPATEYGAPPSWSSGPPQPLMNYDRPNGPNAPKAGGRGLAVVIGVVIALVGLGIAGVAGAMALNAVDRSAADESWQEPAPTYGVPGPRGEIGDGVWKVGVVVHPGTYRVSAPIDQDVNGNGCQWTEYSSSYHTSENKVDWGEATAGLPAVKLSATTEFESLGCGEWVPVDPATFFNNPDAPVGLPGGAWLIGEDFAPGVYRTALAVASESEGGSCDWSIFAGASQSADDVIDWQMWSAGRPILRLEVGQSFNSGGCGDWIPVDPETLFQRDDAPSSIAPGVWLAGEDFAPGMYQATPTFGPQEDSGFCFWAIGESWDSSSHIGLGADFSKEEGARTVTLESGQRFESAGCGEWKREGS